MKRFLTVLLVIAVMFTFSFGTSLAAEYSLDDYNKALTAEKANQVSYMQAAKTQAINKFDFDAKGNTTIGPVTYSKAAIEAAADAVIAEVTAKIDEMINAELNAFSKETSDPAPSAGAAPSKAYVDAAFGTVTGLAAAIVADDMKAALSGKTEALDKVQAPIEKKALEDYIASVNTEAYPADNAETSGYTDPDSSEKVSSADYVQILLNAAKKTIADNANETATVQRGAYVTALGVKATIDAIDTLEDIAIANGGNVRDIDTAINTKINEFLTAIVPLTTDKADYTETASPVDATAAGYGSFVDTKAKTVFGVAVADVKKITRAEAVAINDAAYATITGIKPTLLKFADAKTAKGLDAEAKVAGITANAANLAKITGADQLYKDVVAYGEELKTVTEVGIKKYDDAKIDAAVKAAESTVYFDIDGADKTAKDYIDTAKIKNDSANEQQLQKAKDDAEKLFTGDIKKTGADKTPESELVYKEDTYAVSADYHKVVDELLGASGKIQKAQSYEEIEKIMADAKEALSKLMLKKDAPDVATAKGVYKPAVTTYANQAKALVDPTKYTKGQYTAAITAGEDLIDAAITVDGVKEAYAEAQKIIDAVKTDEELKAEADAVKAAVAALPYDAAVTANDEAAVKAAYDAIVEYEKTPGHEDVSAAKALAAAKLNKVYAAKAEALQKEAEALADTKLPAAGSDAYYEAVAALADKAEEIAAANAELETAYNDLNGAGKYATDILADGEHDELAGLAAEVDNGINSVFEKAQYQDALNKMKIASKDGATEEQIKAAADAYAKLTQQQKFELESAGIETALVEDVLAKAEAPAFDDEAVKAALQDMSIVARSTKLSSGKIKVTVKADTQEIIDNGYTVKYKFFASTKSSKSGYAKKIEKATKSFTTSGVKGKKNYWKVTVKVYNADGELVAKTPLTQCRYACRTL